MKIIRKRGDTSNILQVFIQDSSSTTGAGLTGLVFNTASLTAYYHRDLDTTATAINLVTMTVGTFTSSGFKEIDATNMPGWYQFCPPDAALGSGTAAHSVAFHLKGATNMAPLPIECQLVAVDVEDATAFGLSRIDGTITSRMATYTQPTGFLAATFPTGTVANTTNITAGTITTVTNLTNAPTAGDLTATMKTSVTTACTASTPTAAAVTGAVGSVTGAVTLNAKDSLVVRNNTATAGAASTITLDGSASAVDTFYVGCLIKIDSGTGLGQARIITNYVGSTKVATVDRIWATNPDATSVFTICTSDSPKTNGSLEVISNSVTGAVGSVTLVSANAIGATSVSTAGQNAAADGILDRVMSAGVDSGGDNTTSRTVRQALRTSRNKLGISAGVATIYKEDDTTASYTAAITTTAGNPITVIDPT